MKLRDLPRDAFSYAQTRLTPEAIDRLVGLVSPELEARRLRARILCEQLRPTAKRNYEGAAKGRRTDGWTTSGTSADAAAAAGLAVMRNRCRDLVRNNPWAERAVRIVASNTVGAGIIPQAKTNSPRRTEKWEALWVTWGDEAQCDVTGSYDFYGIQTQVIRSVCADGECFVRRVNTRPMPGVPPLALQVLEADYLDTSKDGTVGGARVLQGVEVDPFGKPSGYWLFSEHPGAGTAGGKLVSKRVPASEILHIYRADRPGQVRGVPWLAPAIIRMRDLDELEDAILVRQKISACFTAFITDVEGLATTDSSDSTVEAFSKFEPGQIEMLTPGKSISFANPPPADGGGEHARSVLRSIASAVGITYEALTNDLSQVNFSSARMGWLESQRNFTQWQQQMLIPQLCKPVWRWFAEACDVAGLASGAVTTIWTPPRREMIDPTRESAAYKTLVRNGFMTMSEVIRQSGRDVEEVLDEIQADYVALDKRGIILDSDPRRRTNIGYDPNGVGTTLKEDAASGGDTADTSTDNVE